MKCFRKLFLSSLCFLFSFSLLIVNSIPTNALELVPSNLELKGWNANPCLTVATPDGRLFGPGRAISFSSITISHITIGQCGQTMWLVPGSFVQIILTFTGRGSQPPLWYFQNTDQFDLVSHRVIGNHYNSQGHDLVYEIIGKYKGRLNPDHLIIGGPGASFGQTDSQVTYLIVNSVSSWTTVGNGSENVTNELKGVGNKIAEVSAGIKESNQGLRNTFDLIHRENQEQLQQQKATTEAVNNQTKQQKEQHDQEKKEENDRENAGKEDSNKLGSLFSFTAFNPFSGLFGLFTGGGCKPIPTIGKMLNKPDATYCPWFPSNVRSILTPVLGISSMMLIFGFFMRWLSGSDLDGTIRLRGK